MTKEDVFNLFRKDHKIVEISLATSYRKYATRRDQLITDYYEATGIPKEEFETLLAMDLYEELNG